ncbi:MAG TPA: creatininase family protein [Longimicrobiaceae bacterium]|nr:creatininase family protein [Longimicrobiaceae bacterium]
MTAASNSLRLTDLTPAEVEDYLDRDRRLIVPVGACDQYGPHLPIGTASMLASAFAERLSHDFAVLHAPPIAYGVNVPADRLFHGSATLREKTLHALLNDILASWEDEGFAEFILLTVHDYDSHVEAVATVTLARSRIRVIELINMDLSTLLEGEGGPQHGGETLTSLMLHLYPERVQMERAVDFIPRDKVVSTLRRLPRIPLASPGSLGQPTLASAEKGRRLYEHIYEKIRTRVFVDVVEE